jgi:hypothetical protein
LWSINEGRHLNGKTAKNYQLEIIQKVFNLKFYDKKGAYPSTTGLVRGQPIHDAITTDYQPVTIDNWELYYNSNNSYNL